MPKNNGRGESLVTPDTMNLHRTPGHLFRRAQQRAVDIFRQHVGENGLRPRQLAVLVTVNQNPGISQADLVKLSGIDRSTVAEMVARLARNGLLTRTRTKDDQRANRLTITEAGIKALEQSLPSAQRAQEEIMAPVPPEERARFLENLRRLADLPDDV